MDREAKPKGGAHVSPPDTGSHAKSQTLVPRPTSHFIGRADEIERLASALTVDEVVTALLIQGGPGIGKTELTKALAHHGAVAERFGDRRWFVSLETATTADVMRELVVRSIGCDPARGLKEALDNLGEMPSLIVLDNLETPWEPADQRGPTEATLAELAQTPGLSLLASFRGRDAVKEPIWTSHFVEPLPLDASARLFSQIAGPWTCSDCRLAGLLQALGGIPLAIDLVARRAHGRTSLQPLWREWERIGADLATNVGFDAGPQSSLTHSIELSLRSRRMTPPAQRLFSLLGCLPDGLAKEDLALLLGEEGFAAEERLLKVGLALERCERTDLLPPIRDHALRYRHPTAADALRAADHFVGMAEELGAIVSGNGDSEATSRLAREFRNIESVFRIEMKEGRRERIIGPAKSLMNVGLFHGISTPIFREISRNFSSDQEPDLSGAALFIYIDGQIAFYRDDPDKAFEAYQEALQLYRTAGDLMGQGRCIHGLGNVAMIHSDNETAQRDHRDALELFREIGFIQGEAACLGRLGEIALENSDYDFAAAWFHEAIQLNRKSAGFLGEATCIRNLAQIALQRSDLEAAGLGFEEARNKFERVGLVAGVANCLKGIGDVALARSNYDLALTSYLEARSMCRQVNAITGEANCVEAEGDVAYATFDNDGARTLFDEALSLYRHAKDVKGERACLAKLSKLAPA